MAKNSVSPIEVKYVAVKGSRGPERRCCAYCIGPIKIAHEAKNNTEPMDHLQKPVATVSVQDRDSVSTDVNNKGRCSLNVVEESETGM